MQAEVKHVIPNHRAANVIRFLNNTCHSDPSASDSIISSIYFDFVDLNLLYEKVNSDFGKSKARIRWYRDPQSNQLSDCAFVELKRKIGSKREKSRAVCVMRPDELENCVLADPRLCSEVRALGELGFEGWHSVAPILEVRYRRRRFIDPVSGASVCVDTDIVVPRVNRAAVTGMVPGIIQNAVVEFKGGLEEFPAIYSPLFRMGLRKCSFSKYLAGYARVMQLVYDPR